MGTWQRWAVGGMAAAIAVGAVLVATAMLNGSDDPAPEASPVVSPWCVGGEDTIVGSVEVHEEQVFVAVFGQGVAPRELAPGWNAREPAISPDGRRVVVSRAFGEWVDGTSPPIQELWTIGIDGTDPIRLTSGGMAVRPTWSPDGQEVLFLSHDTATGAGSLAVVPADGSGPQRHLGEVTVFGGGGTSMPRFAPDGSTIVLNRGNELLLIDPDGSNERVITTVEGTVSSIVWDPGGDTLTVTTWLRGEPHIEMLRVDVATGEVASLGASFQARWSLDGERLYLRGLSGDDTMRVAPAGSTAGPRSAVALDPPLVIGGDPSGRLLNFDVGPCLE